jgi:uncharacterized protein
MTNGPVVPTRAAVQARHPISDVRFDEAGLLGSWQRVNADQTIPHCIAQLEQSGALGNLWRLRDRAIARRPPRFSDSDLYKTLEACGWADTAPEFVTASTDLLACVQEPDGYLNSWVQGGDADRFTDFAHGHEMYCAGHLIQAGIADARTTGDTRLLGIGRRFADLLCELFGERKRDIVPGHPEVETALVELYRQTGAGRYLELAKRFIDLRGRGLLDTTVTPAEYFQDHRPVRDTTSITGHAVRATYLAAGATDVAVETGDVGLLAVMERLWADMATTKTYLTGGIGSRQDGEAFGDAYELPPDRAYCETCAGIASIMWSWRLLLATGKACYADLIERTLLNCLAAATSPDGRAYFYVNPLQVRSAGFAAPGPPVRREPWHGCACCPPNIARLRAALHHYVATFDGSGVQVHQYFAGTLRHDGIRLVLDTRYPWDGTVTFAVRDTPPSAWTLTLRVPAWCAAATVRVNGAPLPATPTQGQLAIDRIWHVGDTVELVLDMPPRITRPHPRVDAVRGCVAVERGPLVYCLEEVDHAARPFEDIVLDTAGPARTVERPDLLGGTTLLALRGRLNADPIDITAVPYFQWANREAGAMRVWIPA